MNTLAVMLKAARESRGWSLSEAAEVIGSTNGHLYAMEAGAAVNPTLRTLAAIVIAYGLRPEALIATACGELQEAGREDSGRG